MYFRVLVTPDGFRYNQPLGNDLEKNEKMTRNLKSKSEIIFVFENERRPKKDWYESDESEVRSISNRILNSLQQTTGSDTTDEGIFELIRSTEKEYLDVVLDLPDAKDGREFNIKYGTDVEGALKALTGAKTWKLVKSAQKNYVKQLKDDPRFDKLSDEDKKKALKKAKDKDTKARDKDAQKILQWMERLEQEVERKKGKESDENEGGLNDIFNNLGEE